ncbi:DNA repair protein RadC [Alkalibacillus filiformis]|uniref:DNA repair protein RadC n=1 Tax=Alkalibacillus filiformis TaxID=200990 RepID=A0ABU0DRW0_9BACI|nr:DNA repair protein RadC [Alkalibacillus filiformis]
MSNNILIRDVPESDRPRERLIEVGPQALSNHELIAILIGSGSKGQSAISLATRLLKHFEGLLLLRDASINELTSINGIGVAKAVQLMAALELGKRIHTYKTSDQYVIRSPEDGANFLMEDLRGLKQEHFVALYFLLVVLILLLFILVKCLKKLLNIRLLQSFVLITIHQEILPHQMKMSM